jgi:hypothetical protein
MTALEGLSVRVLPTQQARRPLVRDAVKLFVVIITGAIDAAGDALSVPVDVIETHRRLNKRVAPPRDPAWT